MARGLGVLFVEDMATRRLDNHAGIARIALRLRFRHGERGDCERARRWRPGGLARGEQEGEDEKEEAERQRGPPGFDRLL